LQRQYEEKIKNKYSSFLQLEQKKRKLKEREREAGPEPTPDAASVDTNVRPKFMWFALLTPNRLLNHPDMEKRGLAKICWSRPPKSSERTNEPKKGTG